ncbi:hypothetical protein Phum_PHUM236490 [Pediculus humanus corporis]|uniref:Uncharacterized protein n=1 Tax=Pediculus humanus subsp. corporis TaxID=121224 RepID=E0VJ07_PEDHC|nr:uncharacterized protein Phum_PHUM236490 [Pediculus humanus corporis]EEB13363.1 hypothetical protein Phum_PHUM236490 [Pediculus humanus corporis]
MIFAYISFLFFIFLNNNVIISGEKLWIPATTTPGEMWNPKTWILPFLVAVSETLGEFFKKAQQILNQLYVKAHETNAFGWPWKYPSGVNFQNTQESNSLGITTGNNNNNNNILQSGTSKPSNENKPSTGFPTLPEGYL